MYEIINLVNYIFLFRKLLIAAANDLINEFFSDMETEGFLRRINWFG